MYFRYPGAISTLHIGRLHDPVVDEDFDRRPWIDVLGFPDNKGHATDDNMWPGLLRQISLHDKVPAT